MALAARAASVILRPLLLLLWAAGALVPRDRNRWVFGSSDGTRFADNTKWLYLHVVRSKPQGVRPMWITRSRSVHQELAARGLPVRRYATPGGLWATLRARVWVFDSTIWDIGYWTSARATKVNLWHGIPLKRVKLDIGDARHPDHKALHGTWRQRAWALVAYPWARTRHDLMIATSAEVAGRLASAFAIPAERVAVTGYPRNDALLDDEAAEAEQTALNQPQGRRVVLYMPTFRQWSRRSQRAHPIDWKRLDAELKPMGLVLWAKLHPRDRAAMPPQGLANVVTVEPNVDPYPLLRRADALITDYSSVFFDYLLLDRPILFHPHDLDEYMAKDRPLYDAYDDVTPGPHARTFDELLANLNRLARGWQDEQARWRERRRAVRDRFHAHRDWGSAQRVVEAIRAAVTGP